MKKRNNQNGNGSCQEKHSIFLPFTEQNDAQNVQSPLISPIPLSTNKNIEFHDYEAHGNADPKSKANRISILFSYSTFTDYALILLGTAASVVHGAGFPLLSIALGGMTTVFLRAENSAFVRSEVPPSTPNGNGSNIGAIVPPISKDQFQQEVQKFTIVYLALGVLMFITSYIQIACWEAVAERVVHRLRQNYLKALLRQEVSWFDTIQTGNLTARLSDDLERVREGLGDKASLFIQMFAAFVAGFVVGIFYSWQMTLVMALFTPALAATGTWMARMTANRTHAEQEKYAVAGAIAEETFSSMRTIHSLNAEQQELERYEFALEDARKTGLLKYMYMAIGVGITHLITHISYAVAFWFASRLVIWDTSFDRGAIFTVFFAVMNGSTALGAALPNLSSISNAKAAARHVLNVINMKPKIDPYSEEGKLLTGNQLKGEIRFTNVHFTYPLRKDVPILRGISFSVDPGKKLALVGPSGCGKSTAVNLLLRFYDPDRGQIMLDGDDLRSLNVRSLREQIGVVSQEPILFDGTLEENILLGNEDATREQMMEACRQANALEFIHKLSDGFRTRVGERGAQLSGGQKQRIAIARALIKDPRVLLLDEATSALDTESETIVQKALNKAQQGRTTIIVAHRLATIREVDQILVLHEGCIVESGTHEELYNQRGIFYEMVNQQQIQQRDAERALERIEEVPLDQQEEAEEELEESAFDKEQQMKAGSLTPGPVAGQETSPLLGWRTDSARSLPAISKPRVKSRSEENLYARKKLSEVRKKISASASLYSPASQPPYLRQRKMSLRRTSESSEMLQICQMQQELDEHEARPTSIAKVFRFNKGNWHFAFFGLLGCTLSGLVTPFFALIYSQIFAVFSEPADKLGSDALFWSGMFLVVGLLNALGFFISANMLGRSGEALTKKLRLEAFRNLLRQDVGFFDDERHNTGKLCTRFATDAPNVRYVFTRLMVVISSVVTLLGAIVIGFIYGWKLALILLAIIPLILASGYFEMRQQFGKKMRDTELLEEAGKVASEAVENIRTVQGLNKQMIFHSKYCDQLVLPHRANMVQVHVYGAVFAFSQSLMFFMYALAFWVGSIFVLDGSMSPVAVFRVFFAIAFCGQSVGQISSFIPDVVKARLAASLLFHLIEYPTMIDSLSNYGISQELHGFIQFRSVFFAYPSRPEVPVLNGLTFEVKAGQTVALVGYSGCGKSTVMALLERFYLQKRGNILLDGLPIEDMNIHKLRNQLCLVSQEPILFDCTIKENIVYGMPDQEHISHERIVRVAELANVHNFILGLPEGYETRVGEKGTQLSGGQKQRIAIARALIREPVVLLLDEATSALDTENEKIVQKALENARQGRTCLVIAHRLSTVQNSDRILVIKEGRVVEQGTHNELLAREGIYKGLCETQILKDNDGTDGI